MADQEDTASAGDNRWPSAMVGTDGRLPAAPPRSGWSSRDTSFDTLLRDAAPATGSEASILRVVIPLAIVLVLMAMAALWWSLTTWRGLEPRWLLGVRHAWSEAGYRASGTWAEFTDWVRLGR